MTEKIGEHHYGEERRESATEKAEEIIRREFKKLGWGEDELERRRKGDEWKVQLAARLRTETTVSLKWIAERLRMGSWKYLNGLLYEHRANHNANSRN